MLVLSVHHFWVGFKPIFKFSAFWALFGPYFLLHGQKTKNSQENAPKIIVFVVVADMGFIYTDSKCIKRQ